MLLLRNGRKKKSAGVQHPIEKNGSMASVFGFYFFQICWTNTLICSFYFACGIIKIMGNDIKDLIKSVDIVAKKTDDLTKSVEIIAQTTVKILETMVTKKI